MGNINELARYKEENQKALERVDGDILEAQRLKEEVQATYEQGLQEVNQELYRLGQLRLQILQANAEMEALLKGYEEAQNKLNAKG